MNTSTIPLDAMSKEAILAARRIASHKGQWFGAIPGSPCARGVAELIINGFPVAVISANGCIHVRALARAEVA